MRYLRYALLGLLATGALLAVILVHPRAEPTTATGGNSITTADTAIPTPIPADVRVVKGFTGDGLDIEFNVTVRNESAQVSDPIGTLSFDFRTSDNTAESVGTIERIMILDVLPLPTQFDVDLVVQGIPSGQDMRSFQAFILLEGDAGVSFASLQASDPSPGPQFFLEKCPNTGISVDSASVPGVVSISAQNAGPGCTGDGVLARLTFNRFNDNPTTKLFLFDDGLTFYTDINSVNHPFDILLF
ncbi:MAG: hypothetical protein IH797_02000, partial [Chloroflexi bacterium]|nr:hypothetical protein [Chloroflexota bacterium]